MNGGNAIARAGEDGRVSVKALSAVFEESQARDAAFVVLLALADWADHGGRCWPSYQQIASKARVSRRTAIDAIQDLVELGELARVPRGHRPAVFEDERRPTQVQRRNLYQILLLKSRRAAGLEAGQPLHHPTRELGQLSHHLGGLPWPGEVDQVVQSSHPDSATTAPVVVQPVQPASATDDVQVVQSATSHIRNRPSVQPSVQPSRTPVSEPSVQRSAGAAPRPPAGTPADNVGVITKVAHTVMDLLGVANPDLPEAVKAVCAREHLAYDSTAVGQAIEAARWQRQQSTGGVRG